MTQKHVLTSTILRSFGGMFLVTALLLSGVAYSAEAVCPDLSMEIQPVDEYADDLLLLQEQSGCSNAFREALLDIYVTGQDVPVSEIEEYADAAFSGHRWNQTDSAMIEDFNNELSSIVDGCKDSPASAMASAVVVGLASCVVFSSPFSSFVSPFCDEVE